MLSSPIQSTIPCNFSNQRVILFLMIEITVIIAGRHLVIVWHCDTCYMKLVAGSYHLML